MTPLLKNDANGHQLYCRSHLLVSHHSDAHLIKDDPSFPFHFENDIRMRGDPDLSYETSKREQSNTLVLVSSRPRTMYGVGLLHRAAVQQGGLFSSLAPPLCCVSIQQTLCEDRQTSYYVALEYFSFPFNWHTMCKVRRTSYFVRTGIVLFFSTQRANDVRGSTNLVLCENLHWSTFLFHSTGKRCTRFDEPRTL